MTVYAIAEKASVTCSHLHFHYGGLTFFVFFSSFRRLISSSLKVYQQQQRTANQRKIILVIYSPVSVRSSLLLLPVLRDGRRMGAVTLLLLF